MRMGLGISQEQTQRLMLTPELRLAIKILQLSTVELAEYIEQELVENPLLELVDESAEPESDSGVEKEAKESEKFDIEWEQYFDDSSDVRVEAAVNRDPEGHRYDNFIAEVPTLQDHLLFQLALAGLDPAEKEVGEFIIGNIDDNGYLRCSVDEVAAQCSMPPEIIHNVLGVIQGFDPAGVGASNLRECLLIQYEQLGINNELLRMVISHHLEEVAEGKIMKVAKKLGISLQEMQKVVDCLKVLEPKPGRKFSPSNSTRYIIPDVVVEKVENEYIILVNDISTPRLTVNPVYRNMLKDTRPDKESREYVETKLNSAIWLIKSIEQRRLTLYRVARSIVDFQREFLDRGIKFLKPMKLKDVAGSLGVHESTVSRATANKYMQTPRGVFEMKFFFSGGVGSIPGNTTSTEAVKKNIKELIEAENPNKPLSDQKIAELLLQKGMEISRRTVAKYRDEMGIPATSRRRRY